MTAVSWLTALLGGALLRRRRRAALGLAAVGSLLAAQVGCGPATAMSEHDGSDTTESSSAPPMSTGYAVPDEYNSDGSFRWRAEDVIAVALSPGPGRWAAFWAAPDCLGAPRGDAEVCA